MEAYSSRELLCIPGKNKSYAIETAYVTELCCQIQLSPHPLYAGVLRRRMQLQGEYYSGDKAAQ